MQKRIITIGPSRYTEDEAKMVKAAALKADMPETTWIRKQAVDAAKKAIGKGSKARSIQTTPGRSVGGGKP